MIAKDIRQNFQNTETLTQDAQDTSESLLALVQEMVSLEKKRNKGYERFTKAKKDKSKEATEYKPRKRQKVEKPLISTEGKSPVTILQEYTTKVFKVNPEYVITTQGRSNYCQLNLMET